MRPQSFDVDDAGQVYVLDSINRRGQRFGRDGGFLSSFAIQGWGGQDIAVGNDGSIYVYDCDVVRMYSPQGSLVREFPVSRDIPGCGYLYERNGDLFVDSLSRDGLRTLVYQIAERGQRTLLDSQVSRVLPGRPSRHTAGFTTTHRRNSLTWAFRKINEQGAPSFGLELTLSSDGIVGSLGVHPIGQDATGRVFVAALYSIAPPGAADPSKAPHKSTILAFSPQGALLGRAELPPPAGMMTKPFVVANNGDVYMMTSTGQGTGMRIIRHEPSRWIRCSP